MIKAYVAVTDADWYRFLRTRPGLDEVNFWQPGGRRLFAILSRGQPFLFKLHYPEHFVVGGAFFAHAFAAPIESRVGRLRGSPGRSDSSLSEPGRRSTRAPPPSGSFSGSSGAPSPTSCGRSP